jgi:squalene-hopene/tetraprenyl-beta-curcumene cyclase
MLISVSLPGPVSAQPVTDPSSQTPVAAATFDKVIYQKTVKSGVEYLLQKGQSDDGSFSKQLSPAVTAMCTSALLEHGIPREHPQIQKSLQYLESLIQPDGGVYVAGSTLRNYETSVALMCFDRANGDGKYDKAIQDAAAFLKGLQWDDGENHAYESTYYGGQGYGSHKRPDASNTSFFLDALQAAGEDGESEAVQKALVFMSRCQNLPSPHNTAQWAANPSPEDLGGMIYSAVGEGESKASESAMAQDKPDQNDVGGLRSYASMTYAGLKSFLYAGVSADDIRVQAAFDWIKRHYDLKSNPGMGQQGLFYYYHVFAKTLHALNQPIITDSNGIEHHWQNDLISQLASQQNRDGSWINPADRWYEGDPNLVTSYALLALSYCDP